ncbi:MAG: DUF3313 family protein [Victivallales bacterium]|nr:DUF3313 family protein [Victivallales bacterium]
MRSNIYRLGLPLGALLFSLSYGCNTLNTTTVKPSPAATFLPHQNWLVRQAKNFPFDYYWQSRLIDWGRYHRIYVAPVNTDEVMQGKWWQQVAPDQRRKIAAELPAVGDYLRHSAVRELRKIAARGGFKVVDKPDAGAVTMELALTQLIPAAAELQNLDRNGDFFLKKDSSARESHAAGRIVLAGKLTGGKHGKLLIMLKDRGYDRTHITGVSAATWYGSAEYNIDVWARQLAAMTMSKRLEDVQNDYPAHRQK